MEFISKSIADTQKLAEKIAKKLFKGRAITLKGDLGAGKTAFTKCLGKALKISDTITSPTFTIMNSYESGKLKLYHFDMYRISTFAEAEEFGFMEIINSADGVYAIEWADPVEKYLPKHTIKIEIQKIDENSRRFLIEGL